MGVIPTAPADRTAVMVSRITPGVSNATLAHKTTWVAMVAVIPIAHWDHVVAMVFTSLKREKSATMALTMALTAPVTPIAPVRRIVAMG